jgi:hypothetical protein
MMEDAHIADGIEVKLLLAGIVLAGGLVGTLGLAPVATQAGTVGVDTAAGDGVQVLAFPIDNVSVRPSAQQAPVSVSALGQDMDPYALGQDVDPYALGQDMDPY